MAEESNRVMKLALEANRNAANVIALLRGVSEGAVATLREQMSFNREALLQFSEERKAKAKAETVQSVQVPMPQDPVSGDPAIMESVILEPIILGPVVSEPRKVEPVPKVPGRCGRGWSGHRRWPTQPIGCCTRKMRTVPSLQLEAFDPPGRWRSKMRTVPSLQLEVFDPPGGWLSIWEECQIEAYKILWRTPRIRIPTATSMAFN
ncbi:uncharacterized protein LOC111519397 [Drosophila willistoni]|uniref:uncharacterized protein LOC111519397 n=1 Tax=Drosophila willistoni TaxID=7260 RepID=UPI001F072755|nr:uncharacterized protein LOC111519397 [Drosophila willistoni]